MPSSQAALLRLCILQRGCGVGNTACPLLDLNQRSCVYACDFALQQSSWSKLTLNMAKGACMPVLLT